MNVGIGSVGKNIGIRGGGGGRLQAPVVIDALAKNAHNHSRNAGFVADLCAKKGLPVTASGLRELTLCRFARRLTRALRFADEA